jgi:hypothetical protein
MRPTNRLFLFALISFFLCGPVSVVQALDSNVTCDESPQYGTIDKYNNTVDTYNIWLTVGQELIIDVDAEKIGSTLDSYLVVTNSSGEVGFSDKSTDVAPDADTLESEDPYLIVTADVDDTYILTISAAGDGTSAADEGSYTLYLECSDPGQTTPPDFSWPVVVGDLLGATDSDTGSLIKINPENAESSLPFPLGLGPIADIEYQFSTQKIFIAVNDDFGSIDNSVSIVAIDPNSGTADQPFSFVPEPDTVVPTLVALEAAENTLYGVQANPSNEQFDLVQVTFDASVPTDPTTALTHVYSFTRPVWALAYHSVEKVIYGVASVGGASHLIKIHLEPAFSVETASIPIVDGTGKLVNIVALDFSHDNFLFGVDPSGSLHQIDHTNGQAVMIGDPIEAVSGLTFAVGDPPDVDPIKTICSSTYTTSASASSGTVAPKLSRFKLKKNPLHRAVGLFKFQGIEGETVTLNIKAEEESAAAVVEESSVNELDNPWLRWKGKGRVFLGIRDSIPGLDFRARKKDHLPLTLSATLPADGTYYVILIRPLLRFYQTDYCVTLESDDELSTAWDSFDVAWPSDDSEDDTASTSAAEPEAAQKSTETVASASADDGPVPVALSTTALEPTAAPPEEITVEETDDLPTAAVSTAVNPGDPVDVVDESDSEGAPTDAGDTTVEEAVEVTPEEPAAGGDDTAVVQTVSDENPVGESVTETPVVAEPAADGDDTAVVKTDVGDSTVDETAVVTPEEPVVETPVVVVPAADEVSGTEPGDETADDGSSDDQMEDPLPMKG